MVTKRGLIWEVLNYLWIIFSFLGFSFISFIYIGTKVKVTKWQAMGIGYLLLYVISIVVICVSSDTIGMIFAFVWLLSMLLGLIHSFLVRKEYLVRRDCLLDSGMHEQELEDLRNNVKKEYKGNDYIGSSGNDTHFDSTYYSNIDYREYEPVSSNFNKEDQIDLSNSNQEKQFNNYYDETVTSTANGKININTCSASDLLKLPGVNQEIADKAISLRSMLGGFNSVQEFIDMMHIDDAYLNEIREKSTI